MFRDIKDVESSKILYRDYEKRQHKYNNFVERDELRLKGSPNLFFSPKNSSNLVGEDEKAGKLCFSVKSLNFSLDLNDAEKIKLQEINQTESEVTDTERNLEGIKMNSVMFNFEDDKNWPDLFSAFKGIGISSSVTNSKNAAFSPEISESEGKRFSAQRFFYSLFYPQKEGDVNNLDKVSPRKLFTKTVHVDGEGGLDEWTEIERKQLYKDVLTRNLNFIYEFEHVQKSSNTRNEAKLEEDDYDCNIDEFSEIDPLEDLPEM